MVWVISDIVKRAQPLLEKAGKDIDNITYGDAVAASILKSSLLQTDFYGISGRIRFTNTGYRYYKTLLLQFQRVVNDYKTIGEYDSKLLSLSYFFTSITWLGGQEHEKTSTKITWNYITFWLYLLFSILALLGILFAIFVLIYILIHRKTSFVTNSYWELNIFVIYGALLLYASIFAFGADSSLTVASSLNWLCKVRKFFCALGFSLVIGPVISKLYYAHRSYIYRLNSIERNARKKMFIISTSVFLITLLINVIWVVTDPLHWQIAEKIIYPKIHCSIQVNAFHVWIIRKSFLKSKMNPLKSGICLFCFMSIFSFYTP